MLKQRARILHSAGQALRSGAFATALLMAALQLPALAAAATTIPADGRELTLTVYRGDVALVQDRRAAELPAGRSEARWAGVAQGLHPGSVRLEGAAALHGFSLEHRPWSLAGLVEAHVGHEVQLVRGVGQQREVIRARVLAAQPLLLENDDGVFSASPGQLLFPRGAPAGMGEAPALVLALQRRRGGRGPFELTYLASGIGWSAEHVALLSADARRMDLVTRARLDNRSGMAIEDAAVDLIAGQVNIPRRRAQAPVARQSMVAEEAPAGADVVPQAAGDQYRFRLPDPLDLADGASRTLRLRGHDGVAVARSYAAVDRVQPREQRGESGWQPLPLETRLEWEQPDAPLPAGPVRVYAREDGALRLVGGDHVRDRPQGAPVRIVPGRPFDLTARRRQTDFRRIDSRRFESAREIRLHNARDRATTVVVEETIPGDWELLAASDDWERAAAHLAVWRVEVPAGGEYSITYRVKVDR